MVLRGAGRAAKTRGDVLGGHRRVTFCEHTGTGSTNRCNVTDGEDARVCGLERQPVDRDPAILGERGFPDYGGSAMDGNPEEQVVGHLAAIAEEGDLAPWIELAHLLVRVPGDVPLGEGLQQRLGRRRGRRDRPTEVHHQRNLRALAQPARGQVGVQQESRVEVGKG